MVLADDGDEKDRACPTRGGAGDEADAAEAPRFFPVGDVAGDCSRRFAGQGRDVRVSRGQDGVVIIVIF